MVDEQPVEQPVEKPVETKKETDEKKMLEQVAKFANFFLSENDISSISIRITGKSGSTYSVNANCATPWSAFGRRPWFDRMQERIHDNE